MKLKFKATSKFKKDYKKIKKRGYKIEKLEMVISTLLDGKELDSMYKDHELIGDYKGFRECHVESDWLLIYTINKEELVLVALRTGSHSDLF